MLYGLKTVATSYKADYYEIRVHALSPAIVAVRSFAETMLATRAQRSSAYSSTI